MKEELFVFGGKKAVELSENEAFSWPQYNEEELEAVARVMSMPDYRFYEEAYMLESEVKEFFDVKYALPHVNGTSALHAAMFAIGVGPGDEVIVPSLTYWASVMPVLSCNAIPVFTESDPLTLNIDPVDIERRITPQTKAIVVVHLCGLPCEMDPIMEIAKKHNLKVIEDSAHTHDAEYKSKKTGTMGDIGCFSYQATKLLPGIEGGMLITNNREYYERAVALGHYERLPGLPDDSPYRKYQHTCMGFKYRMHPLSAAIIRVQLKKFVQLNAARNNNLSRLDHELSGIKGLEIIKTPSYIKRNYYCYRLKYHPEELGGLSRDSFIAALQSEGLDIGKERYVLLHQQPVFIEENKNFPWTAKGKVLKNKCSLPVTEKLYDQLLSLPTFPQASEDLIDNYIYGFKKVAKNAQYLVDLDIKSVKEKPDMDWNKMQMPKVR